MNKRQSRNDSNPAALIMAGGFGRRLYPLTEDMPKPMLPLVGKPMLEYIILNLKRAGVRDIIISTHYMAEKIESYFKDGSNWDLNISYVHEDTPLGTGGALSLVRDIPVDHLFVLNGDILSTIDFTEMLTHHISQNAKITIATKLRDHKFPYGVVTADESGRVQKLVEKPVQSFLTSGGMYVISKDIVRTVKNDEFLLITDLIEAELNRGTIVTHYPIAGQWMDVGRYEDVGKAEELVQEYFC